VSDLRAFVDESDAQPHGRVPGFYVVAAAIVDESELEQVRYVLRTQVTDDDQHKRLHYSRIKDKERRRRLTAVLSSLRGTSFVVVWATGYTRPADREAVRAKVLDALLSYLLKDRAVGRVDIERREGENLRRADARVASGLKCREPVLRDFEFRTERIGSAPVSHRQRF